MLNFKLEPYFRVTWFKKIVKIIKLFLIYLGLIIAAILNLQVS